VLISVGCCDYTPEEKTATAREGAQAVVNMRSIAGNLKFANLTSVNFSCLLYFALFETRSFRKTKTPGFKATAV
jgi:hypothetical protein